MKLATPQGHVLERVGPCRAAIGSDEIQVFACVRDEVVRLPHFLDYYRELGVSRFIVVDNASSDGTSDLLRAQCDVDLFHTSASYAASRCGVDWLNCLLGRFGPGHWALVVDADELLVYPRCESTRLPEFVGLLEESGADALLTFLLDMYPDGPIREARYLPGEPFLKTCPYFDRDSYVFGPNGMRAKIPARGGVRRRLFWRPGSEHRGRPPVLAKVPLVRWRDGLAYQASTHEIGGLRLAPSTGVLLHFKLFSDFADRTEREVARGEHWDQAAQYAVYAEALAADPELCAMYEGSVRFRDSRQLVELGLMIEAHRDPAATRGTKP